ncbi:hypothetical protein Tco_0047819 [Tanacetum coccineum]
MLIGSDADLGCALSRYVEVMSTPAYVDSETITQADGAQSSRVPVPLPDDPYVAVRHAQLVDTDTESDPEEAPSEAEESQPLGSRVPLMSEEFEASEPSGTRTVSSYSPVSSDSTAPLSPDHPLTHVSPTPTPTRVSFHRRTACMVVRTQPTLSPGMSSRIAEAAALSPSSFRKRYRSSYKTSSSSSPTLPVRKRYRGTSELILDTDSKGDELGEEDTKEDESSDADESDEGQGLEDEGPGMEEEEEAAPEGQQQAVPIVDTTMSEPLGLGYGAAKRCALKSIEEIIPSTYEVGQSSRYVLEQEGVERISAFRQPTLVTWAPPSPEWSLGSLLVSPSSPVVPSPISLLVATPAATISVDEDHFIEVGVQLELHGSILHDHIQRLDALPPTLITDIDRDVRELYTRSGAVRDEIFLQRYRFRSLEREQERATVTFGALWRPVLALEAWTGHVDTRLADMSRARYDDHRLIHDMIVHQAAMHHNLQEMTGRVTALEQKRGCREP